MDCEWFWYVIVGSPLVKKNKPSPTLVGDVDHEEQGEYGKSLYIPLNFTVKLNLL